MTIIKHTLLLPSLMCRFRDLYKHLSNLISSYTICWGWVCCYLRKVLNFTIWPNRW